MLFGTLAVVLLVAPTLILALFGVDGSMDAIVTSNRAAALFTALFTLAWLGHLAKNPETRTLVLRTLCVAMAMLILVGLYHFATGQVGPGIALALMGETAFMFSYLRLLRISK